DWSYVRTGSGPGKRRRTEWACATTAQQGDLAMAALSIAFDAPDNGSGSGQFSERPIDFEHIARQTLGDKALELEVLQLFARQARASMKELSGSSGAARAAVAHRLKGSAQAVGAGRVSQAAQALED